MPQMERAGSAPLDCRAQDRLEVMLRHVDDEGIARVVVQKAGLHRRPCGVGCALHVTDLVDAQRLGENVVGDTVAAKGLERAREDGSGLGVERELRVIFEQRERQAVEIEPQRGRETDRARADNDDGRHAAAHQRSCAVKAKSRLMIEAVIVARSDNKKRSGPTASSGCPTPTVARQCASSAPALASRYCGVSSTPGAMRLNRTRCGAISLAALLTNAISAALLAA